MKPTADSTYLVIGKIGATHGVRGWLKVHSYTEVYADIFNYLPWFIRQEHHPHAAWKPIEIEDYREMAQPCLVKFNKVDSPEAARFFTNHLIAIPRTQLSALDKDEFYWSDLVGLSVIDQHKNTLGKVLYLMETGSNDVMVVKGDKEMAIPFLLNQVIVRVDLALQEIHVNWEPL